MSAPLRRKKRRLLIPRGSLLPAGPVEPPYADIGRIDSGAHKLRHVISIAVALSLHAAIGLAALSQHEENDHPPPRPAHRQIAASIQHIAPPPRPPPPPPPPRAPAHNLARAPLRAPPATPPPPAQAGRAVAMEGPADLTSFDMVVGQGTSYAGGSSSAKGTGREAVHEEARVAAPPRKVASRAQDLSRAPGPLNRDWACAWPDEAQDSDLRDARVTLRVHVSRAGEPTLIDVVAAPPGGFGEAAHRCAEAERYRAALDANGVAIDSATPLFNVHFLR